MGLGLKAACSLPVPALAAGKVLAHRWEDVAQISAAVVGIKSVISVCGGLQPPLSLAGIASSAAETEGEGPGLKRALCGSKPSTT